MNHLKTNVSEFCRIALLAILCGCGEDRIDSRGTITVDLPGGTASELWFFGDDERLLDEHAWYRPNTWDAGLQFAQSVGTKLPNTWGLHDMYGNVWEWCQDWGAFPDPEGGYLPILRGGSFYNGATNVRSAVRIRNSPDFRFSDIGARLVKMK